MDNLILLKEPILINWLLKTLMEQMVIYIVIQKINFNFQPHVQMLKTINLK